MTSSLQTGLTSITGSVTAAVTMPIIPTGATIRNYSAAGNGSTQTAMTITAGKIGYVVCFSAGGTSATFGALQDNAGTVILQLRYVANSHFVVAPGYPIAVYTAGQAVKVTGDATGSINLTVIEVSA